ncbi:hypothetical protein PoB_006831100 [Plakobranchus ocellatus]|uniref:Uncharacterized protein n=1 Tax=Plakobranchus ocellatus TaxID=259542 RepID=A0AAV4DD15_9GAST|nr:hypothetical protein PoB_006831100 [Plakobranchus ocellatus]
MHPNNSFVRSSHTSGVSEIKDLCRDSATLQSKRQTGHYGVLPCMKIIRREQGSSFITGYKGCRVSGGARKKCNDVRAKDNISCYFRSFRDWGHCKYINVPWTSEFSNQGRNWLTHNKQARWFSA